MYKTKGFASLRELSHKESRCFRTLASTLSPFERAAWKPSHHPAGTWGLWCATVRLRDPVEMAPVALPPGQGGLLSSSASVFSHLCYLRIGRFFIRLTLPHFPKERACS